MHKKSVAFAAATALSIGSALAVTIQPAGAVCYASGLKGSTWTLGQEAGCGKVQARLYRYYGGILTYYGPQAQDESYVEATSGTDAGHAFRWQNTDGGAWQAWVTI